MVESGGGGIFVCELGELGMLGLRKVLICMQGDGDLRGSRVLSVDQKEEYHNIII